MDYPVKVLLIIQEADTSEPGESPEDEIKNLLVFFKEHNNTEWIQKELDRIQKISDKFSESEEEKANKETREDIRNYITEKTILGVCNNNTQKKNRRFFMEQNQLYNKD